MKAGTDLACGREYASLIQAVKDGLISEAEIDVSVKRLLTARFRLGMFDPPEMVSYARIPFSENDSPAHRALSLRAAQESIVLLKNENNTVAAEEKHSRRSLSLARTPMPRKCCSATTTASRRSQLRLLPGLKAKSPANTRVLYSPGTLKVGLSTMPIPSIGIHGKWRWLDRGLKG